MLGKAGKEAAKYLRKLKKELKSRDKPEILKANDNIVTKKKPKRISEMTDERLEREKQLLNPNLTYEERVELLGGKYKKGGSVKKMNKGGMLKAVPEDNKGLGNLPEDVRNKMGYMKKGGSVKKMKHGGSVKSHRGDGICKKGKTKGRMV